VSDRDCPLVALAYGTYVARAGGDWTAFMLRVVAAGCACHSRLLYGHSRVRVCVSSSPGFFPQLNTHRHARANEEPIEREVLECPGS
jgi:hypothetical protein